MALYTSLSTRVPTSQLMISAIINALDINHRPIRCRVLLDTCSTANFMTERLAAILHLLRHPCTFSVGALNDITTHTKYVINATIQSSDGRVKKTLSFLTITTISEQTPAQNISRELISIPPNIKLADPEFFKSAPVDMLLGAGPTLSLLSVGQYDLSTRETPDLFLQKTLLGWVIGGNVQTKVQNKPQTCHITTAEFDLERFWQIEEGPNHRHYTPEEIAAEKHFQRHHHRDSSGRYVVALPFNEKLSQLGDSRDMALKRFVNLERKFERNANFKREYTAVIDEYIMLEHMKKIEHDTGSNGYYLPHHAVFKESSTTTKLRVVFDASAKTTTGVSLNDTLMVGPTIQRTIFAHLIEYRTHNIILIGDVEKMYRQFLVRTEDRCYQRIFWRDDAGKLSEYELSTITFGTSSAPFQAVRCSHQLADDESHRFPIAARILKRNAYVDDYLAGFSNVNDAKRAQTELTQLLQCGGLNIRQWASNNPQVLQGLPESSINRQLQLDNDKTLKTLGLYWDTQADSIVYTVHPITIAKRHTKRQILSEVAKIFDPIGLLGPIILTAKLIIQKLWQAQIQWDESVPSSVHTSWINFCSQLNLIEKFTFSRKTLLDLPTEIQLHGFCDASERGYGACIYLRSRNFEEVTQAKLLCSKSRVAPLKTTSLPRLELCAAQLLTKLYLTIKDEINLPITKWIFWTDSMITLHWIKTEPCWLKTFVANRVAEIQQGSMGCEWRHVRSNDNPADALSRGQLPSQFIQNDTWQSGPNWLIDKESNWPISKMQSLPDTPELKKITCFQTNVTNSTITEFLERQSSFSKLRRIVAYCQRLIAHSLHWKRDITGPLRIPELVAAEHAIIRFVQGIAFQQEIHELSKGKPICRKSKLLPLSPFLDKDGLLRVGGRLQNSNLPFDKRHQMIIPKNHHVTGLIIQQEHVINLHAGTQTTLYATRQRFWLMDGRNQIRKHIKSCYKCCRVNPPSANYVMGYLPRDRVNAARPFSHVGIDYCGPFYIKERKNRNRGRIKTYVAVFVCLVVKAVHLELVSDMTTPAFLGALRRFAARRGKPQVIQSDNGSNFKGAKSELEDLVKMLQSQAHNDTVREWLSEQNIVWQCTPPLSPHFGGIWEAAVKSFKHHLRRVAGNQLFTFEELNTLIIQVEAILNSRPLTPMSTDPHDLLVLTPGHFLIGDSLNSLPEHDYCEVPNNRLSHWQHIQKVRQDFWARWYKEYLNELNIRHKWSTGTHSIKPGSVVLLKEDNIPPMQWKLGRVIKSHPGPDGVTRVVTVKTMHGTFDRNIRKLAPLPVPDDDQKEPSTKI